MSKTIITPIIYPTSAEFWKGKFPSFFGYTFNNRMLTDLPDEYTVSSAAAQCAAERFSLSFPVSLISGNVNRSHEGKYYTTRWQKAPFPPNSFLRIPNFNIYIACPELTFLQAARHLDFVNLVQLGFDLCSQYYSDKDAKFGQTGRTVITTAKQIIEYAESSNHMHGSAKAIHAAKYILNNSNSPMETKLAIMLELPIRLGGYGLSGLEMNGTVKLSKHGQELMGFAEIRGDLVWRKQHLAVEYNSKLVHNNDATFYKDSNRATSLRASGWKYIGVTPDNIKNFSSMENLAGIIRKQLALREKKEILSAYEKERRANFVKLFL